MTKRVWGVKLGSYGAWIPFCEEHSIVGIGWKMVSSEVLKSSPSRQAIQQHVKETCDFYKTNKEVGSATGQLYRFREARAGDYVVYYDPPRKQVQICRVINSELYYRDFELANSADIWHFKKVEYPIRPIPILDFYGAMKGSLLGPRMSFWDMSWALEKVELLVQGLQPHKVIATDPKIEAAYQQLREHVLARTDILNERDWEWLVVDYLKAQGAHVDERKVGGNHPIIDVEARFDHGEFNSEIWRVQVKYFRNQLVDWPLIDRDYKHVDDGDTNFCYVAVNGFTEEAKKHSDEKGILLMERDHFTRFLLSGKMRPSLQEKLCLPFSTIG